MSKFLANDPIVVRIIVAGQPVLIPGIATADSYVGERTNHQTGATVPTEYVDAITYHDISAEQSRTGEARTYWKRGPQSAAFAELRTAACPELDDLSADELLAKVAQSLAEVQQSSGRVRAALRENAAQTKAHFGAPAPQGQRDLGLTPTK